MTTKFKGIKWLVGPCSLLLTPLGAIRDVLDWVKEELDHQPSPTLPSSKEDTDKREH